MRSCRFFSLRFYAAGFLWLVLLPPGTMAGDEWLPISPEELQMKSDPNAPGAHAIYLYREELRDDAAAFERRYNRIKILTEEGKKHADVEVPYLKGWLDVREIKGRVVQPDGRIVDFEGKPFDKMVVKARGIKILVKTFTLPDVEVGSIVEYRYVYSYRNTFFFRHSWILQDELFTRRAHFALRPDRRVYTIRWINVRVPNGKSAQAGKDGMIHLDLENIPAFQEEEFMPPENVLKSRVDFFYTDSSELDAEKFWKQVGKRFHQQVDDFVGHRKGIERAVAEIVSPQEAPEAKLRRLYARAQSIRNLSFEPSKTEQEEKREKLKESGNVEDVLKRGYGYGEEINWLFLAFARAAGFEAYPVKVSRRSEYFFDANILDSVQLNDSVVLVRLNGHDTYFDPGTRFCPFGLLPWPETGVKGLRLDKDGGVFVTTTTPSSEVSRIERKGSFAVNDAGELEGKMTVGFTGLECLRRRLSAREEDEVGRREMLEEEVKSWFPVGTTLEMESAPDWEGAEEALRAEFRVRIPNWANSIGRRLLLPVWVFAGSKHRQFDSAARRYPVYFDFPYQTIDEVTLKLPEGYEVSSVAEPQDHQTPFGRYELSCRAQGDTVTIQRRLSTEALLIPVNYYAGLRAFFGSVRSADEEQVVLQASRADQPN